MLPRPLLTSNPPPILSLGSAVLIAGKCDVTTDWVVHNSILFQISLERGFRVLEARANVGYWLTIVIAFIPFTISATSFRLLTAGGNCMGVLVLHHHDLRRPHRPCLGLPGQWNLPVATGGRLLQR